MRDSRLRFLSCVLPPICLAPALVAGDIAAPPPENEREAMVRVVTNWDLSCEGSTRTGWRFMSEAWYDEITNSQAAPLGHGNKSWYADGVLQPEVVHVEWTAAQERDGRRQRLHR